MYYYAYGSNLSSKYVRKICPSATLIMKAKLLIFSVEFRHYSEDRQGGISSIVEAPGQMVHGVILEIPESEIEELDIVESVPEGLYRRDIYSALGHDGEWYHADLYRTVKPAGPYAPAKEHLDDMIGGAQEHGLDAEYTEKLAALRKSVE
jgi:gamma-glutamylcyclotransferase (GGCT)/AIG2-like uncharacterized protein YtfP